MLAQLYASSSGCTRDLRVLIAMTESCGQGERKYWTGQGFESWMDYEGPGSPQGEGTVVQLSVRSGLTLYR